MDLPSLADEGAMGFEEAEQHDDDVTLEFQDIAHTSDLLQPDIAMSDAMLEPEASGGVSDSLVDGGSGDGSKGQVWQLEYWRQYFDVDTSSIMTRCIRAVLPAKGQFFSAAEKPDLYGPFWIITTIIVLLAILGNFAEYVDFIPSPENPEWRYDFEKITFAASVYYSMISVVPLMVYIALRYIAVAKGFVEVISVYGYSFTIYLPIILLCSIPVSWVRWLLLAVAWAVSSLFVAQNLPLSAVIEGEEPKKKRFILVGLVVAMHAIAAVLTKLYFFW